MSLLKLTDSAVNKIKSIISKEKKLNLNLRVYITGGGCSGFQYKFILDNKINKDDFVFEKQNIKLLVDVMSIQYLIGGYLDYKEDINGSRFFIINPNAKITCSCGSSFNV